MPIDLPTPAGFIRSSFGLEFHTQTFTSPLTRHVQRVQLSGARWMASYTICRMKASDRRAAAWISFFLRCEGMTNSFNAYDPDRRKPRGTPTGEPLVKGAGQSGGTLLIDGCMPNVAGWLRAGDYFSLNGQMHQMVQDANTDNNGETTLHFRAAMRSSPADNAPLNVTNPTCAMILIDDSQGVFTGDQSRIYDEITFSAMEVF